MDDKQLRQNILDELEFEPSVDAASVGVAVHDGVVTLSGHYRAMPRSWPPNARSVKLKVCAPSLKRSRFATPAIRRLRMTRSRNARLAFSGGMPWSPGTWSKSPCKKVG